MFLFKIFGALDILAAITFILTSTHAIGVRLPIILGAYLLLKGFIFNWDILSIIDFLVGACLLLTLVASWLPLAIVCCSYLSVKGVWSWF